MDEQAVHIEAGGDTEFNNAQIQRIGIIHQRVDGVAASLLHDEAGFGTGVHDHKVLTFGQHVQHAVSIRHSTVTIRSGADESRVLAIEACFELVQGEGASIGEALFLIADTGHNRYRSGDIQTAADVASALIEQTVHIEAGGNAELHDGQVQGIGVIHQGMDGVRASRFHIEDRILTHLLDHQARAFGEHVDHAVAGWHVHIAIRYGTNGHTTFFQAILILECGQCTSIRIIDKYARSGDIQAGANGTATLDQQTVHLEARGHTRFNDRKVQGRRVVDQGVDRVGAGAGDIENGYITHLLDDQPGALREHVEHLITGRNNSIAIGDTANGSGAFLKAIRRLESVQGSGIGLTRALRYHHDTRTRDIEAGTDVAATLVQQVIDIKAGGNAGLYDGEVKYGRVVDQRVYGVATSLCHVEDGGLAHLLDHQARAFGEHIDHTVTHWHIQVAVRHCAYRNSTIDQAVLGLECREGTSVRIIDKDAGSGDIQAGANGTAALHEQTVHIEAGRNAELHNGQVQGVGVVHQGMDGVQADGCDIEYREGPYLFDHKAFATRKHVDPFEPGRYHGITDRDTADGRPTILKTIRWLESIQRTGIGRTRSAVLCGRRHRCQERGQRKCAQQGLGGAHQRVQHAFEVFHDRVDFGPPGETDWVRVGRCEV